MPVRVSQVRARWSGWVAAVSAICIVGWALPALLMLDKGFGIADEGTYVTSYRFWSSNPYFVSGAQYVYGPIFEALGESIPGLRLLRLGMVVGINAWFAWSFLAWLDERRPDQLPASRPSLVLLLTAAGGMSYLWTPLTPGYYDLTADCCLVLGALLFLTLRRTRSPSWIPLAIGVVGVVLVVTKWTAFTVVVLVLAAAAWHLARGSRREALRYLGLVAIGVVAALVACQLFVIPVWRFVTTMWRVSALTAVGGHSFAYLASHNVGSTLALVAAAVLIGLPLFVGLAAARAAVRRADDAAALRWLVGTAVLTTLALPFLLGWRGGGGHGRALVGIAIAALACAIVAAVASAPSLVLRTGTDRVAAAVLILVPVLQAAGTNLPFLYVAAECLAMWVALVLLLGVRAAPPRVAGAAVLINLMVVVVATSMISGTTTLMSPFETTSWRDSTARVPQLGLRVAPTTARQYDALVTALGPYVDEGSTPVITLDQKTGLTYLLGGVPAGSTWTDAATAARTAGLLELACRHGDLSGTREPVLVVDRAVDPALARAMTQCGYHYPDGYRRLDVVGGPPGVRVLVPDSSG